MSIVPSTVEPGELVTIQLSDWLCAGAGQDVGLGLGAAGPTFPVDLGPGLFEDGNYTYSAEAPLDPGEYTITAEYLLNGDGCNASATATLTVVAPTTTAAPDTTPSTVPGTPSDSAAVAAPTLPRTGIASSTAAVAAVAALALGGGLTLSARRR